jgi:hypothetical protein
MRACLQDRSVSSLRVLRCIRLLRLLKLVRIMKSSHIIRRWETHITMSWYVGVASFSHCNDMES